MRGGQGRKAVTVEGVRHLYDPFHYLILRRGLRFQAEILQGSVEKPFLSFVLQVDPAMVRRICADMAERSATTFHRPLPEDRRDAYVSPLDLDLLGAALRFVKAVGQGPTGAYWRRSTCRRSSTGAAVRAVRPAGGRSGRGERPQPRRRRHPLRHRPDLRSAHDRRPRRARQHEPSAFAHLFRDVTGMSPYQFVKRMRLDRARGLLVDGTLNVSEVAKNVGYSSLSAFITEFKRHFGVTPRVYADAQRGEVALRVDRATAPI